MKTKIAGIVITIIMLIGCQQNYVTVPSFEVKVDLDERAERELRSRKETIIVWVDISGTPQKNSGVRENNKALGLVLGSFKKELDSDGVVKFENQRIPAKLYQALENKDYSVSISVVSGRRSSDFNLLYCDHLSTGITRIAGKQHVITCKLIRDGDY